MANWSNPTLTSTYTNFLAEVKDRDVDLALAFDGVTISGTLPTGAIRWDSAANRWKKWNGSAWAELAATYALTNLSTTGTAYIGSTLTVVGGATLSAGGTTTTVATADNSTAIASTAFVKAQGYAALASPTFTGAPSAPTAAVNTNSTQIATTAFVNSEIANDALLKTGGSLTGPLILPGDPTADLHAVPRQYIDSLAPKTSCRVATTTNIGLAGTQVIDGISLSIGDRVLVKDQAATNENGIYIVAAGAWARSPDADTWNDLVGAYTTIEQGGAYDDTMWMSETARGGTLNVTAVTWQLVSHPQLANLGNLITNGIITRTGTNTFTPRSVAVAGVGLAVTNGDGVAGNPTISSNATSANAPNQLVSRDAGGNIAVQDFYYQGNVYSSGGTGFLQVPVGTTAQRPGAPSRGMVRFNTSVGSGGDVVNYEGYNGTEWKALNGFRNGGNLNPLFGTYASLSVTNIPDAARIITIGLYRVRLSGTAHLWLQAGDSSGTTYYATGYAANSTLFAYPAGGTISGGHIYGTGAVPFYLGDTTNIISGTITLTRIKAAAQYSIPYEGSMWTVSGNYVYEHLSNSYPPGYYAAYVAGRFILPVNATLGSLRFISSNGTDTFSGTTWDINFHYQQI